MIITAMFYTLYWAAKSRNGFCSIEVADTCQEFHWDVDVCPCRNVDYAPFKKKKKSNNYSPFPTLCFCNTFTADVFQVGFSRTATLFFSVLDAGISLVPSVSLSLQE